MAYSQTATGNFPAAGIRMQLMGIFMIGKRFFAQTHVMWYKTH